MPQDLRLHSSSSNPTGTAEQIDSAIVFGAGASLPALPSQQGLVDRLHGARPHPRIALAQRYLRRVFPGLPNPTIRFEDVVGPLEIAEAEEHWFHFAGTSSDPRRRLVTNKAVLDSFDTWLAMSLDPETIPKPTSSRRTTEGYPATISFQRYDAPSTDGILRHARLVYLLSQSSSLKTTGFLSLNDDVLLDRVLYASAGAKTWIFIGYSLPLADVWMLGLAQACHPGAYLLLIGTYWSQISIRM